MNKKNLANAEFASAVNTSTTTWPLKTGHGSRMPAVPFFATATVSSQLSTVDNSEIVQVTAVSGDNLTVVRAQRGTVANSFSEGDIVANGVYVEDIDAKATKTTLTDGLPTTIGTNGQVLKSNGTAVTWQADANTTYTEITDAEIDAGTASTARAISGRRAQKIVDKARTGLASSSDLTSHSTNTNNPHSVTKAQVGLGNVDNTSDVDKPISTATQTALDGTVKSATSETVTVSSTEPASPQENDIWFDPLRKTGYDDIDWTTFLNGKIEVQYGAGSITAAAGTVVSDTVTFTKAFSGTPMVLIQSSSAQTTVMQTMYAATNRSATGFTVNARHPSASGAVGYQWIAVYANFS